MWNFKTSFFLVPSNFKRSRKKEEFSWKNNNEPCRRVRFHWNLLRLPRWWGLLCGERAVLKNSGLKTVTKPERWVVKTSKLLIEWNCVGHSFSFSTFSFFNWFYSDEIPILTCENEICVCMDAALQEFSDFSSPNQESSLRNEEKV